jgi:GntR family transcriptional regulator / MocR family aminotransferase
MSSAAPSPRLRLRLERRAEAPFYRQIYARIRAAILDGTLPPGTRLPSWNALAEELGVARGTVRAAYEWLAGEGYIIGEGAAGTRVHRGLRGEALRPPSPEPRPAVNRRDRLRRAAPEPMPTLWGAVPKPFQVGMPAVDAFPRGLWSRLVARQARNLAPAAMTYPDPAGYPPLRAAIARYLAIARGVVATPEQIFITAGYTGALDLVTRALLRQGDAVWIEDPGYPRTRAALALAGASPVPIAVDGEGLVVERGIAAAPRAQLAIVTASHQAPLGMALSLPRRLALLDWAARGGGWIVEDDYYGEFQLRGQPVPALKSLDRNERVLYVGTFSKVLMPSLRLGYVVGPVSLLPLLDRIAAYLAPSQGLIAQAAVADFMVQGHFARHIRRMRRLYAERRAALVKALAARFGDAWEIGLQESGMHLLARLPQGSDDVVLVERAAAAGLGPVALSPWAVRAPCAPGLLLSFANIPAERAADEVDRLAKALAAPAGPRRRAR